MKVSLVLLVAALAGAAYSSVIDEDGHNVDTLIKSEEKRAVIAGTMAVAAAGQIIGGLANFFSGINGPSNVKDTVIKGRAMQIVAEGNCATVTDRDTGFKSSQCGDSGAHAAALATEELVTLLIKLGQISIDDLHLRPQPATRPPTLCKDHMSLSKCQKHMALGHCHVGSPYFHWMHENCYRSCAGCNSLDVIFQNPNSQGY